MKKLLTIIFLFAGSYVFAQSNQHKVSTGPSLRLNGYATYAFDDNHVGNTYSTTSYIDGKVFGGFEYGGGLEVMLHEAYGFEITYLRLDSKADLTYYDNGPQHTVFGLATNWIMAGGNRYLIGNPKIEPYGGLMLGMAVFNVTNPDKVPPTSNSATKFAWGLKLGANIWASEKVGIKIQTSLLSAVQSVGGGVYFGTGGTGAGVSTYSTFYQFVLGGGLVFKLGGK